MPEYGTEGQRLFEAMSGGLPLGAERDEILNQACLAADDLARLEDALSTSEVMVTGSMGQQRPNPLFAEVRASRALLARFLAQVDDVSGTLSRSAHGRKAARARWSDGVVTPMDNYRTL